MRAKALQAGKAEAGTPYSMARAPTVGDRVLLQNGVSNLNGLRAGLIAIVTKVFSPREIMVKEEDSGTQRSWFRADELAEVKKQVSAKGTKAAAKAEESSSVSSDSEDDKDPCKVNVKKLKKSHEKSKQDKEAVMPGNHWSDKTPEDMSVRDWRIFREDHQIATKGGKVPLPMRSWDESKLPQDLLDVVKRVGYAKPSAIQMQCIPIGCQNRDCVGLAETGSGKTVAYLFPMLVYIKGLPCLNDETKQVPYPYR